MFFIDYCVLGVLLFVLLSLWVLWRSSRDDTPRPAILLLVGASLLLGGCMTDPWASREEMADVRADAKEDLADLRTDMQDCVEAGRDAFKDRIIAAPDDISGALRAAYDAELRKHEIESDNPMAMDSAYRSPSSPPFDWASILTAVLAALGVGGPAGAIMVRTLRGSPLKSGSADVAPTKATRKR